MLRQIALVLALLSTTPTTARDVFQEFAQYSDEQRDWLRTQKSPKNANIPCCNESDGTKAEEDIRDGHYWVSFEACYFPGNYAPAVCSIKGPMMVPDEAVIKGPNMIGRAVVWYSWENRAVRIRCYVPGAGL